MDIELPKKRKNSTYELIIYSPEQGRFKLYLSVGVDDHGRPLEIWLDCAKEGTTLREFMHAWAALFSIALQSGVSLHRLIRRYKSWRFEPCGRVEGYPKIETCESMLSLVASVLEAEFPKEASGDPPGQKELFSR